MRRPSPATLISLLALFVALGGPAEAAKLITGKQVKRSTLTGKHIKNRSLATADLTSGAIASLKTIAPGSVVTPSLADGAVTTPKLAGGAVGSPQIVDQGVGGIDIATNAVSADEVAPNSISADEIAANSIQGDEVQDGFLGARDVGSFAGTVSLDFDAVAAGGCQFKDADVAAVAVTNPPRSVGDDAVLVTPPSQFPDDQLILSAAPVTATKVRVRVCSINGAALDPAAMTFRYISFDF